MATLIPTLSSCVSRMTAGERRTAERLEQKLDDDYLLWYDVPVGPQRLHPDFIVLHPRRGLLILEVKDWRVDTLIRVDRETCEIHTPTGPKTVANPLEQARHYAHAALQALRADPQLVHAEGRYRGELAFPWSYGVVLPNITRAQFDAAGLAEAMAPSRAICRDEMTEAVEAEALQSRLWDMFPYGMRGALSLPQIERVRWILFPEVRVPVQASLLDNAVDIDVPDLMRVMDLQQEQLARSLGDGHRVIHGVAGSGKTMILGYRAEQLARSEGAPGAKPILVLCYNKALAQRLDAVFHIKGIADRVHAVHFHKWCWDQLVAYHQTLPSDAQSRDAKMAELVQRVIDAVNRRQIPSGQYRAVLIDEGHDFEPEWLRLVVQMVDPQTNSLLVLYDDAQRIYGKASKARPFSFKSVGIQAQGRSTILRINYRNTRQILDVASRVAAGLLTEQLQNEEDGVPRLAPIGSGREGPPPQVIRLPTLRDEAMRIAELLRAAHQEGHSWADMAILCRLNDEIDLCATACKRLGLPFRLLRGRARLQSGVDAISLMTMHASKGLEFPVVALAGVGQMPAGGKEVEDEARVFYVAATRATQHLIIGASGQSAFAQRLTA